MRPHGCAAAYTVTRMTFQRSAVYGARPTVTEQPAAELPGALH